MFSRRFNAISIFRPRILHAFTLSYCRPSFHGKGFTHSMSAHRSRHQLHSPGGTPVMNVPSSEGAIKGPCYMKLLVPDRMAGVIIGKGGSGITELEHETSAFMRLSGGRVYFPGTHERVMIVGGEMSSIERIIPILVHKLNDPEGPQFYFRLVLTNTACSCIIGKGGDVVKAISAETGASIRASERMHMGGGHNEMMFPERIVDVKAAKAESVVAAVTQIVVKIQEDANFREFSNVLNYGGSPMHGSPSQTVAPVIGGHPPPPPVPDSSYYYPVSMAAAAAAAAGAAGAQAANLRRPGPVDQYPISIDFCVPSQSVGAIIGKNGEARNRIVHSTGANVVISERTNDPLAERRISVTGPLAAVQAALTLVVKHIVDSQ